MLDWLKKRIIGAASKVLSLAEAALDGLKAVWNVFTTFLHVMRIVFADLGEAINAGLHLLLNFVEWTARTLYHVAVISVPNAARWALDHATAWAASQIASARAFLNGLLNAVRDWAARQLADLLQLIQKARDYLFSLLAPIINWYNRYAAKAVDIVLHPDKLAAWLLPALWGPLWRYVEARAATIGSWLLARSVQAVLASAGMIESVIARIL